MDFTQSLLIGFVTGIIGLAYFVYGKKQSRPVPLIAGIGLMVYPYFIDVLWLALVVGVALAVAPFVVKWDL